MVPEEAEGEPEREAESLLVQEAKREAEGVLEVAEGVVLLTLGPICRILLVSAVVERVAVVRGRAGLGALVQLGEIVWRRNH